MEDQQQEQQEQAPPPDPVKVELEAAKAQLAEMLQWKAQQEKAAEEAARERMTDKQRLEADRAKLDAERKALKDRARGEALAKLGVLEKAYQWAPDVDPADPAGAAALEAWAKANPELVRQQQAQSRGYEAPPKSPLAEVLSGARKTPLLSAKWAQKLLGGN